VSRQGIALRGDGDEKDSNFMQLLFLHSADEPKILSVLERKTYRYTSPQFQNELLKPTTMTTVEYLFGTVLGECILSHADNLCKSL